MKTIKISVLFVLFSILLLNLQSCGPDDPPVVPTVENGNLAISFSSVFGTEIPNYSSNEFVTSAKDTIKPSKFKFILSNIKLVKSDNTEQSFKDVYGYISFADNKTTLSLANVEAGTYVGLKFTLGLDSAINHGDPTQWASNHPLNPAINDLHWGWAGGYIFMAHEGSFKNNGIDDAYTFHIATEQFINEINIPLTTPIVKTQFAEGVLNIKTDLAKYFDGVSAFSLKTDGNASHSNAADAAMINKLRANIKLMFSQK